MSVPPPPSPFRPLTLTPLLVSALGVAMLAQLAWRDPRLLAPLALAVLVLFVPPTLARLRMRRLLMSGDVERVLGAWQGVLERVKHPETMAPLMAATAYAAYGWVDAARTALDRAARGPAWEAAIEQRLFVETLLDAFEGERASAMAKALLLERMPMPRTGPLGGRRVVLLRRSLSALARAFAHQSLPGDERLLQRASRVSPLVHWAMRYAGAILAIDAGRPVDARALLAGAPTWPSESAYLAYHDELALRAG